LTSTNYEQTFVFLTTLFKLYFHRYPELMSIHRK